MKTYESELAELRKWIEDRNDAYNAAFEKKSKEGIFYRGCDNDDLQFQADHRKAMKKLRELREKYNKK